MIYGMHSIDVTRAGIYFRITANCSRCMTMCMENAINTAVHSNRFPEIRVYIVTAPIIINSSATATVNPLMLIFCNCPTGFFNSGNCFIRRSPFLLIHSD